MSKKTAIIIIVAFILLVVGGFLAFYFYTNRGVGNNIIPNGGQNNLFPNNPSGTPNPTGGSTTPETPPGTVPNTGGASPALKELSNRPSAGATALATSSNNIVMVRFVEKGTGNVYEVSPETSDETRLSNTTIPKIAEVIWHKDGAHLVARYLKNDETDTIQTYYAALTASADGSGGELQGSYLAENIKSVGTNPDRNKLFYIVTNSGGATGIISDFNGSKKIQIFDSPLKEWLATWPTPQTIALTTKPSASVPGFMFLLNTQNGALTRAVANIKGLTTLVSPDASSMFYSETVEGGFALKRYSFKSGESQDIPVTTLPEKCVWSKNDLTIIYCSVPTYLLPSIYPDGWYQGIVAFSDDIWKIDATTGAAEILVELKQQAGKDIDGTNLFLSQKEDYLFFTNKYDSHIWSLRLQP